MITKPKTKEELIYGRNNLQHEPELAKKLYGNEISELKKVAKNLQKSEMKFRFIMENSADPVFIIDQQGRYLYTNKAVSKMLGYSANEMKNMSIADLSPPHKVEEYLEFFKQLISDGEIFIEIELLKKNGSYLSTDLNSVLLTDGNIYASCRDISKRKRIEQLNRESTSKLLQLNADKDRFISILSHDLKNPFLNLMGLSEILIEDIHAGDLGEIEPMAKQIQSLSQHINDLLDEILDWGRMQHNGNNFNPQRVAFQPICTEVLKTLRPMALEKDITIAYSNLHETTVFADVSMLKTILRNLISNAIKFTNKKGKIDIRAELSPQHIVVTVSDNGMGIEPERLKKLFQISEVFSSPGTEKEKGTGLGLVLCKEFIEKHGGKIWIDSIVGKGSDFKFTLPLS